MREYINRFDATVTAWVQTWPGWLHQPMLAITNVGQPLTVILLTIGLMIWALSHDRPQLAVASVIVIATIVIATILKLVLRRARPVNEYVKQMIIHTFSFPSGHAVSATVGFGFLALLLLSTLAAPWAALAAISLCLFALLVCVSRIYLGAHYPSDVAAGIVIGMIGLLVIIFGLRPFA